MKIIDIYVNERESESKEDDCNVTHNNDTVPILSIEIISQKTYWTQVILAISFVQFNLKGEGGLELGEGILDKQMTLSFHFFHLLNIFNLFSFT